jgi:hypothetical protein
MKSVEIREHLVQALGIDLVGPDRGSLLLNEVLPQSPSRWYLTGFLVPVDADESQKTDETAVEEVDSGGDGTGDDSVTPEQAAARRASFPSSMGLSLLLPARAEELTANVRWGDYHSLDATDTADASPKKESVSVGDEGTRTPPRWQRTDREEPVQLKLPPPADSSTEKVPGSNGLELVVTVRLVQDAASFGGQVPKGTRSVSVFLVNRRTPVGDAAPDPAFAFQAALEVTSPVPLVPRPNLSGLDSDDWDDCVADLQYCDAFEYAVGHNVSTRAIVGTDGQCREVHTRWIPAAEVERVAPADISGVDLGMESLAQLADGGDAQQKLGGLVSLYRQWIDSQNAKVPASKKKRKQTGDDLLKRARVAANRIEDGINLLTDPIVLGAFRTANRVMAIAQRRRRLMEGAPADKIRPPAWRPFQLAFLLMNLRGIVEPGHVDREVVDLLFFPTGGGKTEAYLGLAAFTLVLRRLRNPGLKSAGLSVLMRYTLRLLTLDQLSRASTVICALELERQKDVKRLGEWPFEIGLWVGSAATPNVMGKKGDPNPNSAKTRTIAYQTGKSLASPVPLEGCPWCGEKFGQESFRLLPSQDHPTNLRITCSRRECAFVRDNPLPIVAVDEPIYRRLPCFLIATVDKFAAMPWTGQVGAFFGRVDRFDKEGFFGPCEPGKGSPLPLAPLLPPDLIIQDELHLISGPMGTMVGLYEAALDELCSRQVGDKKICPKIVASTATVRRAQAQIQALFNRALVDIFPPPGPNCRDSFFARTHTTEQSPARLYVGIAAQGRSAKRVMLRTYLTLLAAARKAYDAAGGKKAANNPADPYLTLLGYFNSLRELGGARRIVEDEVNVQLRAYSKRKREGERDGLFADREIDHDVLELTSRVGTDKVAEARRRLGLPYEDKEHVDVAIATNMISVGLDIQRLGLMVVLGQPKTSSEYIQATSRVGRSVEGKDSDKPGLVVTVLNINRPRDRSHYERFAAYHQTFYRSVEATSVTPFSPRALDRGLAGNVVALARHMHTPLTPPRGATEILRERGKLAFVLDALEERAAACALVTGDEAKELGASVRNRVEDLLDKWKMLANDLEKIGGHMQYQPRELGDARPLLHQFLDTELRTLPEEYKKFRANRSMRNVEPGVGVRVKDLDDKEVEGGS